MLKWSHILHRPTYNILPQSPVLFLYYRFFLPLFARRSNMIGKLLFSAHKVPPSAKVEHSQSFATPPTWTPAMKVTQDGTTVVSVLVEITKCTHLVATLTKVPQVDAYVKVKWAQPDNLAYKHHHATNSNKNKHDIHKTKAVPQTYVYLFVFVCGCLLNCVFVCDST